MEASAETGRQRLGAEGDGAGRRCTINPSRGGERCWGKSTGAEGPGPDSRSVFPTVGVGGSR